MFIAETPLYEFEFKNSLNREPEFAFNDAEKEYIIEQLKLQGIDGSKYKINRSKGLGENDPEMMSKSTMNPLTRRLTKVEYPTDDSQLADYFNALLGTDIETRRILIEEYFNLIDGDID